ncbi:MAG: RagB/SusD family nutrient uptake outer membrane protein [Dysgonamonadaceae bacterium]|jgi:hypothetical protein|nr:RagB/SusD family nutrient uptake outer membrane protein [Dysgonamonadaceae bacterium]
MKKIKNIKNRIGKIALVLSCCAFVPAFTSCEDFLDRPPYDQFDDTEFWQSEAQARAFMYGVYPSIFPGYGTGTVDPTTFYFETSNDDYMSGIVQTELYGSPGNDAIPTSGGGWSFTDIRKANYIIENVDRLPLDEASVNHWRGVGRFFRAVFYSNMVFTFGDVPYMDKVPVASNKKEDLDYLYKDREPRTLVVGKIMEDFQYAMDHCRTNDGSLQINKYVAAAMASRLLLREGTYLKYHNLDAAKATECLEMAKAASELVMSNTSYKLSDDYKALFASDDLGSNPEVIMYRKYAVGVLEHNMQTTTTSFSVQGASRSLAESFSTSEGFPIYWNNAYWMAPASDDFFANRDPRLTLIFRSGYYIRGEKNLGNISFAISGFSCHKYIDDAKFDPASTLYARGKNITDAPCLRLGEVLLNYAEICYELGLLTQGILDQTINVLRDRKSVGMPHLQMVGGKPAVDGQEYDDPKRLQLNPANDVSELLWEIRRERRVELAHEGFRRNDLKRWKKLDYMMNAINPDIRYGAYIRLEDYKDKDASIVVEDPADAKEGYILGNTGAQRVIMPTEKNYISPVPADEIGKYANHGYKLSQTKAWESE